MATERQDDPSWPNCEKHKDEEADYFCMADHVYFCRTCLTQHQKHDHHVLEEIFKVYWEKWSKEKEDYESDVKSFPATHKDDLLKSQKQFMLKFSQVMKCIEKADMKQLLELEKDFANLHKQHKFIRQQSVSPSPQKLPEEKKQPQKQQQPVQQPPPQQKPAPKQMEEQKQDPNKSKSPNKVSQQPLYPQPAQSKEVKHPVSPQHQPDIYGKVSPNKLVSPLAQQDSSPPESFELEQLRKEVSELKKLQVEERKRIDRELDLLKAHGPQNADINSTKEIGEHIHGINETLGLMAKNQQYLETQLEDSKSDVINLMREIQALKKRKEQQVVVEKRIIETKVEQKEKMNESGRSFDNEQLKTIEMDLKERLLKNEDYTQMFGKQIMDINKKNEDRDKQLEEQLSKLKIQLSDFQIKLIDLEKSQFESQGDLSKQLDELRKSLNDKKSVSFTPWKDKAGSAALNGSRYEEGTDSEIERKHEFLANKYSKLELQIAQLQQVLPQAAKASTQPKLPSSNDSQYLPLIDQSKRPYSKGTNDNTIRHSPSQMGNVSRNRKSPQNVSRNQSDIVQNRINTGPGSGSQSPGISMQKRLENGVRELTSVKAHDGEILVVLELSDGQVLLTAGYGDYKIKAWHISNKFKLLQTFTGHSDSVTCLAEVDSYIISGCNGGNIIAWKRNLEITEFSRVEKVHSAVGCLNTLKSQGLFLSAGFEGKISLWQINHTGLLKLKEVPNAHSESIFAVEPLLSGLVATGSQDKNVKLWDIHLSKGCSINHSLTLPHKDIVNSIVSLSMDKLATGTNEGKVNIWSISKSEIVSSVKCHPKYTLSLQLMRGFHIENNPIMISIGNEEVMFWNVKEGKCLNQLNIQITLDNCFEGFSHLQSDFIVVGLYSGHFKVYSYGATPQQLIPNKQTKSKPSLTQY